jgi:glycosyltransferase involved in cell wall biosynthesis
MTHASLDFRPHTEGIGPATRAVVFGERPTPPYLARRTIRSLTDAGLILAEEPLEPALASARGSLWLVREGAWLAHRATFVAPPSSRTCRPLCALGAVLPAPGSAAGADEEAWARILARTGGDLDAVIAEGLPPLASVWLEPPLAAALARRRAVSEELSRALAAVLLEAGARVVRHRPLDVHADARLRVAEVVTSLQQGGAERVVIELSCELRRLGVPTSLIALGGPTRAAFASPTGTVHLPPGWAGRPDLGVPVLNALAAFGADLIHGHLIERAEVERLGAAGIPLMLTIHNVRAGWPEGTAELSASDAALLVGCSRAVESELSAAGVPLPTRTVWNGIDFTPHQATPARAAAARRWRRRLGLAADDLVLLAVANPRPQKRLQLLPRVLAATRDESRHRGERRRVRLVLAGGGYRKADRRILDDLRSEAARLGLANDVRVAGSVDDMAGLLAAADVLVSTSAYEGLSLAQIEALASGLPVVATAVGGTPELAAGNAAMALVDVDAPPAAYAREIVDFLARRPASGCASAAVHFTRERMARAYARLYPRAVSRSTGRPGRGLLLVTNNLSTGGAQSSARRLLLGLREQGVGVRAAVLQEQPRYPTPGRRALLDAGLEVLALSPAAGAEVGVAALFEAIDLDPPEAVLLWNALAEDKVLLADGLLDVPVFDVSPGEMYYESLDRYFERPRPGLPYRTAAEYGARLAGVIVKYEGEADRAARVLGAPVHVIPNGVPPADPVARGTGREGPVVIGTLARLDRRKKVDHLLEAVARANGRLPPHLVRIGGGVEPGCASYAEALRERASTCRVDWRGEVLDPAAFLRELDIFALVAEPAGCPNSSLEAMSVGLPVVATDVGGMSEQVVDGVTGRLVPSGDPDAMAEALVRLSWDAVERARLGAAGHARVRERFSLERMVTGYRRICLPSDCRLTPFRPILTPSTKP